MCPALRVPIRPLSRMALRLISNKSPNDVCDIAVQSASSTESGSYGDADVIPSSTPSQESTDGNEIAHQSRESTSNETRNRNRSSRAPSIVSSSTDQSQGCAKSCQWVGCDIGADVGPHGLLSHIQEAHVLPQLSSKTSPYTCFWSGCKVYGHSSVSPGWLARHVQVHSEAKGKPFSCIFDKCPQRFSSPSLLQRHIDRVHTRSKPDDAAKELSISHALYKSSGRIRNRGNFKSCTRRIWKRKRRFRFCRVQHTDFYDTRSKTIIKNRVVLDKLFADRSIESLIEQSSNGSNETFLSTGLVALPGPIGGDACEQASPEKRVLRSAATSTCGDVPGSLAANKPDKYRVQLLLTFPHIFVGQRLTQNKREYLVKWQGDVCANVPPVMWVLEEEVKAANAVDKL